MSATSEFYLAQAAENGRAAHDALLPNVRERCLRSQAAWLEMAKRVLATETKRDQHAAAKAAEAAVV